MNNKLVLDQININGNKISYQYTVTGEWANAFRTNNEFFIEYGFNVESCPYSVAVIPFLGNVLPIAWVFNAEIVIREIDADFLESIDEIKRGYQWMSPNAEFKGALSYSKAEKNKIGDEDKCCLYFSGGIDANSSLAATLNEKPLLVTIWGTDIFLNDVSGWEALKKITEDTAQIFNLDFTYIKTSFRLVTNCTFLNEQFANRNGDNWWHGFQHGLALITHAAPLAYVKKIRRVYFSSTNSVKSNEKFLCASHPTIDNNVRFCSSRTIHEGFENTRQDKIRKVCRFYKNQNITPRFHVCWITRTGYNCCACEKCGRTIFGILAENYDPRDYGFPMTEEKYDNFIDLIKSSVFTPTSEFWNETVTRLSQNKELIEKNSAVAFLVEHCKNLIEEDNFIPTEFHS